MAKMGRMNGTVNPPPTVSPKPGVRPGNTGPGVVGGRPGGKKK